jgi:hypothetical protein
MNIGIVLQLLMIQYLSFYEPGQIADDTFYLFGDYLIQNVRFLGLHFLFIPRLVVLFEKS